jgi:hypothetical protein
MKKTVVGAVALVVMVLAAPAWAAEFDGSISDPRPDRHRTYVSWNGKMTWQNNTRRKAVIKCRFTLGTNDWFWDTTYDAWNVRDREDHDRLRFVLRPGERDANRYGMRQRFDHRYVEVDSDGDGYPDTWRRGGYDRNNWPDIKCSAYYTSRTARMSRTVSLP